jgi:FkbM family methyltransferase
MRKLSHSKQRLLSDFSRELDKVDARAPMKGSYARIDPYIVDRWEGGRSFEFICYHKESAGWFDTEHSDVGMTLMHRHQFVRPGDVVFDIGSNSGYMSVWYGLMVGHTGKVLAFDPYPWNALATNFNARLNYLDNVTGHEVGLSDSSFDLALPLDAARTIDGFSSNSIRAHVSDIREFSSEKPTFLKIDIEGGEFELSRTDLRSLPEVDRIFLELHPFFIEDRGLDTKTVLKNFARQGFELRYAHPLHKPTSVEATTASPGMWFLQRTHAGG